MICGCILCKIVVKRRPHIISSFWLSSSLCPTDKYSVYGNDQEDQKAIELANVRKDAEFNRKQAEARRRQEKEGENQVEWWQTRNQHKEYKHDRDRKHYADQIRRNEALK